jgi:hypothetical protein
MGDSWDYDALLDPDALAVICHAAEDADAARNLAEALREHDIGCQPASDTAALVDCDALLLLFSPAADASEAVLSQLALADTEGVPIIPLRVAPGEAEALRGVLEASKTFDATAPSEQLLSDIAAEIRTLAGLDPVAISRKSVEELTEAAVNHPMNVAQRRNGVVLMAVITVLVLGAVIFGVIVGPG